MRFRDEGARLRARAQCAVAVAAAAVGFGVLTGTAGAATPGYSTQLLHFDVHVGPAPQETCDIIGELVKPDGASAAHPAPAILSTNGFGGAYGDQVPLLEAFAKRGYVGLAYSGIGFGGSACKIELDSPLWDGEAAQQLITFLGGGSAAEDGTTVNYVIHDKVAHNGVAYKYDPRVGMIGGSYGGEVQFAAADVDPRLDTIIPQITWNDLSYSLAPNNALDGADISETSGVAKFEWIDLFTTLGVTDGIQGVQADPSRDVTTCPNFDERACSAIIGLNTTGNGDAATLAFAQQASVDSYISNVKIPTMLMQGEDDTLFNLHEAVANYAELRAEHTPVKMVWQSWGHSDQTPAPGEWAANALNSNNTLTVEGKLVAQWFAHYLKLDKAAPALNFSYYQPWVNAPAANAVTDYASAPEYPVPASQDLYLSGTDSLTTTIGNVTGGASTFAIPPAGAPASVTEVSAVSQTVPLTDVAGTYSEYETAPLTQTEDVVGIPKLTVQVSDSLEDLDGGLDPSGGVALFFKLEDIAPDGTATLPDRLISPARFTDFEAPVTVSLPGIVHRFAAGDRIALFVAASDAAYRGNLVPSTVTVDTSPSSPGVLSLPMATAASATPLVFASAPKVKKKAKAKAKPKHKKKVAKQHRARR